MELSISDEKKIVFRQIENQASSSCKMTTFVSTEKAAQTSSLPCGLSTSRFSLHVDPLRTLIRASRAKSPVAGQFIRKISIMSGKTQQSSKNQFRIQGTSQSCRSRRILIFQACLQTIAISYSSAASWRRQNEALYLADGFWLLLLLELITPRQRNLRLRRDGTEITYTRGTLSTTPNGVK